MQQLIDYIEKYAGLNEDAVKALEELSEFEYYRKNQAILEPGQRCNKIWFLKSGMVRKYHIHEGKEITTWIHTENDTFTSLKSYAQNTPADEYLQACENTTAISITRANSEKLVQYPAFFVFSNSLMEEEFVKIDVHTRALNSKDARGKYEYLRIIAPEMVKRARLGHIASILGLTQETLSRIRRR